MYMEMYCVIPLCFEQQLHFLINPCQVFVIHNIYVYESRLSVANKYG